jgi:hypothetical protein
MLGDKLPVRTVAARTELSPRHRSALADVLGDRLEGAGETGG